MAELQAFEFPPPIKGMIPQFGVDAGGEDLLSARFLENFIPDNGVVRLRPGIAKASNNAPANIKPIQTLVYFPKQGATAGSFVVAGGTDMYTVSAAGAWTVLTGGGLSNTYLQTCFFNNKIFCTNGQNDVFYWDGAAGAIVNAAFVGPGGDDKALIQTWNYKGRLYFVEGTPTAKTTVYWYGALSAITGALTSIDLSTVLTRGGNIEWICSWSYGSFTPSEESLVVCSTEGEILIYSGDNPGATNWTLSGRFFAGQLAGAKHRSYIKVENEIYIITLRGLISLTSIVQSAGEVLKGFISDPVEDLWVKLAGNTGDSAYIVGCYHPADDWIVVLFNKYIQPDLTFARIDGYERTTGTCLLVYSIKYKFWSQWKPSTSSLTVGTINVLASNGTSLVSDLSLNNGYIVGWTNEGASSDFWYSGGETTQSYLGQWFLPFTRLDGTSRIKHVKYIRPLASCDTAVLTPDIYVSEDRQGYSTLTDIRLPNYSNGLTVKPIPCPATCRFLGLGVSLLSTNGTDQGIHGMEVYFEPGTFL